MIGNPVPISNINSGDKFATSPVERTAPRPPAQAVEREERSRWRHFSGIISRYESNPYQVTQQGRNVTGRENVSYLPPGGKLSIPIRDGGAALWKSAEVHFLPSGRQVRASPPPRYLSSLIFISEDFESGWGFSYPATLHCIKITVELTRRSNVTSKQADSNIRLFKTVFYSKDSKSLLNLRVTNLLEIRHVNQHRWFIISYECFINYPFMFSFIFILSKMTILEYSPFPS